MCIYVYICPYVHIYIYTLIITSLKYVDATIRTDLTSHIGYIVVYIRTIYIYMYTCVYIYIYIGLYIYTYICIFIYIYKTKRLSFAQYMSSFEVVFDKHHTYIYIYIHTLFLFVFLKTVTTSDVLYII
jgi:hypothetical protein